MPGSPCLAWGNFARTQPPNPCRPATSSIDAPMMAISRAARSSMRLTAAASQVGLSLSTQGRKPASMVSESKGRGVGFIQGSRFQRDNSTDESTVWLRRRIGDGFVKPNLAKQTSSCSPAGGLGPNQGSISFLPTGFGPANAPREQSRTVAAFKKIRAQQAQLSRLLRRRALMLANNVDNTVMDIVSDILCWSTLSAT